MPNRIVRETWIDSPRIDQLDANAERFYLRLILKADDFGRFHGHHSLLRAGLFPLKDDVRNTDIARWIAACEKAGVLRCYEVDSKPYIQVNDFKQRTRLGISKFPNPPTDDGQMTVKRPSSDGQTTDNRSPYSETETETETESETLGKPKRAAVAAPPSDSEWLASLKANPAYHEIDIDREHGKMTAWCGLNGKMPSRRRFLNWLNRAERPMGMQARAAAPRSSLPEPPNWQPRICAAFPGCAYDKGGLQYGRQWAELSAADQRQITESLKGAV